MNAGDANPGDIIRVRTAHSDYVIDEGASTIVRTPRDEKANACTGDGETLELVKIITLEIGVHAEFDLIVPGVDMHPRYRRTTAVEEISVERAI